LPEVCAAGPFRDWWRCRSRHQLARRALLDLPDRPICAGSALSGPRPAPPDRSLASHLDRREVPTGATDGLLRFICPRLGTARRRLAHTQIADGLARRRRAGTLARSLVLACADRDPREIICRDATVARAGRPRVLFCGHAQRIMARPKNAAERSWSQHTLSTQRESWSGCDASAPTLARWHRGEPARSCTTARRASVAAGG